MSYGWADKDTETLKTMWAEGFSASQIARALPGNHTRNAVLGKVHRLSLLKRVVNANAARGRQPPARTRQPKPRSPADDPAAAKDPGPMSPPLTTLTVRDHHCKWPYDVGNTYHYCGQEPVKDRPFCLVHCRIAYQPQQPRKSAA